MEPCDLFKDIWVGRALQARGLSCGLILPLGCPVLTWYALLRWTLVLLLCYSALLLPFPPAFPRPRLEFGFQWTVVLQSRHIGVRLVPCTSWRCKLWQVAYLCKSQFPHPHHGARNSGHLIRCHVIFNNTVLLKDTVPGALWEPNKELLLFVFCRMGKTFKNEVRGNSPELVSKCN